MDGTFHRRELKPPSIAFSSTEGRQLFSRSLEEGNLESYFVLAEHFITQGHPAFCGVGSLTMALNSLLVDPKRVWQGVWRWFDESMLDCCEPHDVIKMKGITMAKLACLARCNGAHVTQVLGSSISEDQFRQEIRSVCSAPGDSPDKKVMIVSYHRPALKQSGSGHFSPIGGYNAAQDMVLIMDVARFKYPPHWVPTSALFQALLPIDPDSGVSRGFLLVSAGAQMLENCRCGSHEDGSSTIAFDCNQPASSFGNANPVDEQASTTAAIEAPPSENGQISPISEVIPAPEKLSCFLSHSCSCCDSGPKSCCRPTTS